MKKTFLALLLLFSVSLMAKPTELKETKMTYKDNTVFMDKFNQCYIISPKCDTIKVTKQLKNIKYNKLNRLW